MKTEIEKGKFGIAGQIWPTALVGRPSPWPHSAEVAHARPARGAPPGMVIAPSVTEVVRLPPAARTTRSGEVAGSSWWRIRGKCRTWWKGYNLTEVAWHRWGCGIGWRRWRFLDDDMFRWSATTVEDTCSTRGVRGKTIWLVNCSKAALTE
jgi:hypothetical protein